MGNILKFQEKICLVRNVLYGDNLYGIVIFFIPPRSEGGTMRGIVMSFKIVRHRRSGRQKNGGVYKRN
jgi:hypothetical protein